MPRVTINPSLRHLLTLCRATLLLFLACEACSFGYARASCSSSAGGMNCRALLQTAEEAAIGAMMNITVPAEITVPSQSRLLVAMRAVGHQHYMYNGTAWVLYNATAWLYKEANASQQQLSTAVMGTHFYLPQPDASGGQPSWQLGTSRVTARSLAKASVDSNSITWNLLQATSHQMIINEDDDGSSSSSSSWVGDVDFVQRLDTQRGLPPPSSSASAIAIGDTYSSVYSALYAFYTTSASST